MKGIKMSRWIMLMSGFLLLLTGCGGKSPAVNHYSLGGIGQNASRVMVADDLDLKLGVGPVTVPDYLKRAQIATRLGPNRYRFDEFNRWSGVLEADISRAVGINLGGLLGTDAVMNFPWPSYFNPDYRIALDVMQFDAELKGDAILVCRWTVTDPAGEQVLASGRSQLRKKLASPAYDDLVHAENQLLMDLSRELAQAVKSLVEQ